MTTTKGAQGWYEDPYRLHGYRWFTNGKPSNLVRDGLVESRDAPPALPYVGSLVPESSDTNVGANGADLQRAGDRQKPDYWDVVADGSTWFPLS